MKWTDEKRRVAEAHARRIYSKFVGKVLLVGEVDFYAQDDHLDARPGGLFRLVSTPDADVVRWCYDFLDPYWNLELIEASDELDTVLSKETFYEDEGQPHFWCYGPTIQLDEVGEVAVDPQERTGPNLRLPNGEPLSIPHLPFSFPREGLP